MDLAGIHGFRIGVGIAVRGEQPAVRQPFGGAVGRQIRELHVEVGRVRRRGDMEHGLRIPRDLQIPLQRRRREGHGRGVVEPLIHWHGPGHDSPAPVDARADPDRRVVSVFVGRALAGGALAAQPSARLQVIRSVVIPGRRPLVFMSPESGVLQIHVSRRLLVAAYEEGHGGLLHDTGVFPLEPVVEPLEHLVPEIDPGTGQGFFRPVVSPGTQQDLLGDVELGEGPEDGSGVRIGPTAPEHDGNLDPAVVRLQGAIAPVGSLEQVRNEADTPGNVLLQPLLPEFGPARSDDIRVRRRHVEGGHHGGEAVEHVGTDAAAGIRPVQVDVVVGRPDHEGLQRGRILHPHLPLHDAAIRHAPHSHVAAAPGLGRDPFHHVIGVPALLVGIDVLGRPARISGAANVEVDDGVTSPGEVGRPVPSVVVRRVRARLLDVPQPAVGVVRHDGREPSLRVGTNDDGRQLHPVPHPDPDPAVQAHIVWRGDFPVPRIHRIQRWQQCFSPGPDPRVEITLPPGPAFPGCWSVRRARFPDGGGTFLSPLLLSRVPFLTLPDQQEWG